MTNDIEHLFATLIVGVCMSMSTHTPMQLCVESRSLTWEYSLQLLLHLSI